MWVGSLKVLRRSYIPLTNGNVGLNGFELGNRRGISSFNDVMNQFEATRKLSRAYKRITYTPAKKVEPFIRHETLNFLYLYIRMKVRHEENIKVFVDHNTIFIKAKTRDVYQFTDGYNKYACWIDLPDIDSSYKRYNISDIKAEMVKNEGELKITIPKLKQDQKVFNVKVNVID